MVEIIGQKLGVNYPNWVMGFLDRIHAQPQGTDASADVVAYTTFTLIHSPTSRFPSSQTLVVVCYRWRTPLCR